MKQNFDIVYQFDVVERNKILNLAQETLWNDNGKAGREYLFDERKIKELTAKRFKLGYVPSGVNHQLANRIVFPVFDASDNLIALSSRLIDDSESPLPVYWHERFNKSFYLYGINLSKSRIRETGFTTVVEGNFDVIKCHDEGFTNVVGLLGTSISEFQLSTLLRYCENVIFIFDNDVNEAGQNAAKRTKQMLGKMGVNLSEDDYSNSFSLVNHGFVELDGANDPDEYIRKFGIISLKKLVKRERDKLNVARRYEYC